MYDGSGHAWIGRLLCCLAGDKSEEDVDGLSASKHNRHKRDSRISLQKTIASGGYQNQRDSTRSNCMISKIKNMNDQPRIASYIFQGTCVFICAMSIFIACIWMSFPSPREFDSVEDFIGTYGLLSSGPKGPPRSYIYQGNLGREIHCVISFINASGSCPFFGSENQIVIIGVARIHAALGMQEVVVNAQSKNGKVIFHRDGDEMISIWKEQSIAESLEYSSFIVIFFILTKYYLFLRVKKKKEN